MRTFKANNIVAMAGLAGVVMALPVSAQESAAPVQPSLQQTVGELIDTLVKQGAINAEQGDLLRKQLQQSPQTTQALPAPKSPDTVRVPFVPEAVKNAIRDEVRLGLREDVVNDIKDQAKQERWGIPGVLPDWVERIKIDGDLRFRWQSDIYAKDNAVQQYYDFQKLNTAGGYGKTDNPYLNTTVNRNRERLRLRLGIHGKVNDEVQANVRLTTGSNGNPVTDNQDLGNYNNPYSMLIAQAYVSYNKYDFDGYNRMTLSAGRVPNPWVFTDLVWYPELNFDGVSGTYRFRFGEDDGLADLANTNHTMFLTMGAYTLQEVQLSSHDKWLLGAQAGQRWESDNQSSFTVALAYYDYINIVGERNSLNSTLSDYTAPQFLQKGNTLFDIRNDTDPATDRWALASDFKEVNLTMRADLANFSPIHVILSGDYVKNIGFNEAEVSARAGYDVKPRNKGYQLQLAVGWPQVTKVDDWRVSVAYKHLERDAVLDAFTDSNFHLGGTDAEGWVIGADYGLMDNTSFNFHWLSANAIDGPPLGINVVQLDISVKF